MALARLNVPRVSANQFKYIFANILNEGDLGGTYGTDVQYIIEVMCCLDKQFNFVDCPGVVEQVNGTLNYDAFYAADYPNIPVRPCRPDVPIAYPEISHL